MAVEPVVAEFGAVGGNRAKNCAGWKEPIIGDPPAGNDAEPAEDGPAGGRFPAVGALVVGLPASAGTEFFWERDIEGASESFVLWVCAPSDRRSERVEREERETAV